MSFCLFFYFSSSINNSGKDQIPPLEGVIGGGIFKIHGIAAYSFIFLLQSTILV
jgi:hypothetical protein